MNKDVQSYIDKIPEDRKLLFKRLMTLISSLYPEIEVKIWWGMPTFMKKPGWVSLANQKNYISLYTNSGDHIRDFKAKYPSIKTGKACINFKVNDFIDEEAIKQVIIHAVEQEVLK